MKTRALLVTTLAIVTFGVSGWSAAADVTRSADSAKSGAQEKHHGMMMGHMMGGNMMTACPMIGLPAGNEKLAMQMHADMMQAMSDIMRKYADKIQTSPTK
nr:hypothetical protein [uncultured Cupriavidus sp.]